MNKMCKTWIKCVKNMNKICKIFFTHESVSYVASSVMTSASRNPIWMSNRSLRKDSQSCATIPLNFLVLGNGVILHMSSSFFTANGTMKYILFVGEYTASTDDIKSTSIQCKINKGMPSRQEPGFTQAREKGTQWLAESTVLQSGWNNFRPTQPPESYKVINQKNWSISQPVWMPRLKGWGGKKGFSPNKDLGTGIGV